MRPYAREAQRVIRPLMAQGIRCEDITLIVNREATCVGKVLAAAQVAAMVALLGRSAAAERAAPGVPS
jgi:hypothetical protein